MVQELLADRFKLQVHRETREVRGYSLVIAPKGPKVREIARGAPDQGEGAMINGYPVRDESGTGVTMSRLARFLAAVPLIRMPVVDNTGLKGMYSFTLDFARVPEDDAPDIFTALQEQLGLRLESRNIPQEFLDRAEKPPQGSGRPASGRGRPPSRTDFADRGRTDTLLPRRPCQGCAEVTIRPSSI